MAVREYSSDGSTLRISTLEVTKPPRDLSHSIIALAWYSLDFGESDAAVVPVRAMAAMAAHLRRSLMFRIQLEQRIFQQKLYGLMGEIPIFISFFEKFLASSIALSEKILLPNGHGKEFE